MACCYALLGKARHPPSCPAGPASVARHGLHRCSATFSQPAPLASPCSQPPARIGVLAWAWKHGRVYVWMALLVIYPPLDGDGSRRAAARVIHKHYFLETQEKESCCVDMLQSVPGSGHGLRAPTQLL